MDLTSASTERIQVWGALYEKREKSPMSVHHISYDQRQWKCARCDCRSTHVGGRSTAPPDWNCEESISDGELDDPSSEVEPAKILLTGATWKSVSKGPPRSWSSWTWSEWWQ